MTSLVAKDLINQYLVLPTRMKNRIDGHLYLNKRNQLVTWNKEKKRLDCEHGRQKSRCKECGGSGICEHGRQKYECKECGGSGICEHGRQKYRCKECGGSAICEHGRLKYSCKECGGSGICEHGRQKRYCKECGGSGICEHGRLKSQCKECNPMGHLINLVRGRTLSALKAQKASKNERTMEYVNCSVAHLYYHIEQQFEPDMNWDNIGKEDGEGGRGWEVDHRRPCASFDLNDEEQKYMCFHWTNLQPMWGQENNEKSNDYDPKTFRYKWIDRETGWVGTPSYLMNKK